MDSTPTSPKPTEPSHSSSKMSPPLAAVVQDMPSVEPLTSTSEVQLTKLPQPSCPEVESHPSSSNMESQPSSSVMVESQPSNPKLGLQISSPNMESQPSSSNMGSQPPAPKSLRLLSPRPESSAEPASLAERLPDELLLLILAGLRDAATLLDYVPLVCRRWRRLARDPRAWDGASLSLTYGIAGSYSEKDMAPGEVHLRADEARFLLHAPASAILHLDLKFSSSALVRLATDGTEFRGRRLVLKEGRVFVPLKEALSRCRARIAGLSSQELTDHDAYEEHNRREHSTYKPFKAVLQVMAAHEEHLQHLTLKLVDGSYGENKFSQPSTMSSALASAGLLEAVRRCSALRSLRCPLELVSAVSAMPGLRELRLDMWNYAMRRPVGDWPAAGSLPALRSLAMPSFCYMADSLEWLDELLEDLARAAPGITRLTIGKFEKDPHADWDDDVTLAEVLYLLPGLRSLELSGGPAVLSLLLEELVEALAELTAVIKCDMDDYVATHADVERLEERRPKTSVDLRLVVRHPAELHFQWRRRQ